MVAKLLLPLRLTFNSTGSLRHLYAYQRPQSAGTAMVTDDKKENASNKWLLTGIIGTGISALCCFTPLLVILLGVLGLSGFTGYLDWVLLPMLLVFVVILVNALWRRYAMGQ